MTSRKQTIAVLFGGRSVEHEVSIITGHQVMEALDQAGYDLLPIYIDKEGAWWAGASLQNLKLYADDKLDLAKKPDVVRVSLSPDRTVRELLLHPEQPRGLFKKPPALWADLFFPAIHGSSGEDGTLQGLFEMADVPYAGSGVAASAIGIDKVLTKEVCRAAGIPVLPCSDLDRADWDRDPGGMVKAIEARFPYPVIVKPTSLGSSIGVSRSTGKAELEDALGLAFTLGPRALVEEALADFIELNCAVLGPPDRASVCEQPVARGGVLTFEDKYKRGGGSKKTGGAKVGGGGAPGGGGAKSSSGDPQGMAALARLVPAPITSELATRVQTYAKQAFRALGATGVARMDFLYQAKLDRLVLNEINTLPGSVSYYLWEATGMLFDALVKELIRQGLDRHRSRVASQVTFAGNLLSGRSGPR